MPSAYVHMNAACPECGCSFHSCEQCGTSADGRCPTCLFLKDSPRDWTGGQQ